MLADVRVGSFATKAPSACADQCPLLPPKDIRKITGVKRKTALQQSLRNPIRYFDQRAAIAAMTSKAYDVMLFVIN
jgi:hypothetical protein